MNSKIFEEELKKIKKKLKKVYKRYIQDDGDEVIIREVADVFKIEIDNNRLEDYKIVSMDCEELRVEILDKKENISYVGSCSRDNYLFSELSLKPGLMFVNVEEKFLDKVIQKSYAIDSSYPLVERVTYFEDDGYELVVEKEIRDFDYCNIINRNDNLVIQYQKTFNLDNRSVKQILLTKRYFRDYKYNDNNQTDEIFRTRDRVYTYFSGSCIVEGDDLDGYCYLDRGNIIYGIHGLRKKNNIYRFECVCFENMACDVKKYVPLNLEVSDFKGLANEDVVSAMVFQGSDREKWNKLEIYKTNSSIDIKYRFRMHEENDWKVVNFELPILNDDKIRSEEIDEIVELLTDKLSNDFGDLVSSELLNFDKKIKVRDGKMEEEFSGLDPKVLINMSLEDIVKLLDANPSRYFKVMEDEFEQITGLGKKDIRIRKLSSK